VKSFQNELEEYLSAKHVIPCANGTDALQIAMMALGLKPGDEVITATFTYVATAEVIALLGLKPVLVDVDADTFGLNPAQVRAAITPKTKAIVPVHLFGQCANMDAIMEIAKEHKLFVVEDTAQAIGAAYTFKNGETRMAGTMGDIGTTSFFPSKNLGCFGDGGAIFTNSDHLASEMRMIANHGQSVRYYHDRIGVNSRLDSIQAAILRCKLPYLNAYCDARRAAADFYDNAFADLPEIKTPVRAPQSSHVFHQYTLQLSEGIGRDALVDYLQAHEIPCMIYYPVALHMQTAYRDDRYADGSFPVTETLVKTVFSLPMHTELTTEQLIKITTAVVDFIKNNRK
jgi:dTDP-4-amino-4,6-dideoxygalactose transaminase